MLYEQWKELLQKSGKHVYLNSCYDIEGTWKQIGFNFVRTYVPLYFLWIRLADDIEILTKKLLKAEVSLG